MMQLNGEVLVEDALDDDEVEACGTSKYLTFALGDVSYALPVDRVSEIVGVQQITRVPLIQSYVRGVTNLRGQVVPIVDLRERCGLPSRAYDARTCAIVVESEVGQVGLIPDAVEEVFDVVDDDIQRGLEGPLETRFVSGFVATSEGVSFVLALEALLDRDYRSAEGEGEGEDSDGEEEESGHV